VVKDSAMLWRLHWQKAVESCGTLHSWAPTAYAGSQVGSKYLGASRGRLAARAFLREGIEGQGRAHRLGHLSFYP